MVLADLGRKITSALQSLSKATVINEEVKFIKFLSDVFANKFSFESIKYYVFIFLF